MKTRLVCAATLIAAFASAMTGCASFGDNFQAYTYVPDEVKWNTKSSDREIYERAFNCISSMTKDAKILYPERARTVPGYSYFGLVRILPGHELDYEVNTHIYSSTLDITKNTKAQFRLEFSVYNKQVTLRTTNPTYWDESASVYNWKPIWNKVQVDSMTEAAVKFEGIVKQCIGE